MWKRISDFFKGCKLELSRLAWPNRHQLIRLTLIVFFVSALLTVFFGFADLGLVKFMQFIFS